MNKRLAIGLASAGIVVIGAISSGAHSPQSNITNTAKGQGSVQSATISTKPTTKTKPLCNGTTVTTACAVEGVNYSTYVYHPAVAEKSHTETVTTYEKKVTGHCTLCNDNTYSPSCATGRGACSWHGGVAQWNAPVYTNNPVYTTNTIVDAPAQAAFYEKVAE